MCVLNRPWYKETSSRRSKDVVLVIDTSSSMGGSFGSHKRMWAAKEAAKTVINTLNSNDRVGFIMK